MSTGAQKLGYEMEGLSGERLISQVVLKRFML